MKKQFDVIVVGAGVAGCSAALFLHQHGYNVGVLKLINNENFKPGESLPPVANKLLQELGLLEKFKLQNHSPCYGNKSLWGSETPVTHDFLSDKYGHGWHINRLRFEQLLLDEVIEKGIQVINYKEPPIISRHKTFWEIKETEVNLKATFLFDASGRNSRLPKQMGLKRVSGDKQIAICGFFEGIRINEQFSFIEAVANGWWYTAPLPDGKVVCSLFTMPDCIHRAKEPTITLMKQLQQNKGLQNLLLNKQPVYTQIYNAGSSVLNNMCAGNYVAIGDAALTFDPISSHGMVMAMTSARDAAFALVEFNKGHSDAFETFNLRLQNVFAQYELSKQQVYASEKRFNNELYWKKRMS